MWLIEDALEVIRILQPKTRDFGYHLCLGGGVLNNGRSEKDLDLYFLPMDNPGYTIKTPELIELLETFWGKGVRLGGRKTGFRTAYRNLNQPNGWRVEEDKYPEDQTNYLHKLRFDYSGLRIDVFVIGTVEKKEEGKKNETPYPEYIGLPRTNPITPMGALRGMQWPPILMNPPGAANPFRNRILNQIRDFIERGPDEAVRTDQD